MGFVDDIIDSISGVFSSIGDSIVEAISRFFGTLLYNVCSALCYIVKLLYEFFSVFAGSTKITYDGHQDYLINVFFGNERINQVYWGMAVIGILFVIVFTLIAVLKKAFELSDNNQQSIGSILLNTGKGVLTILLLSAVMSAVMNLTNVLVKQVNYLFDNAGEFGKEDSMTFTDEQFATMARVYNTIGNYGLNGSYNSRYNVNSCYNAIRQDLLELQRDGVFDFYYDDNEGKNKTWQSQLQKLVRSADPRYELPVDQMEAPSAVIVEIMEDLKKNKEFYPLQSIQRNYVTSTDQVTLDVVIFLTGTMEAANNPGFNVEPSITDSLRGPFYYGEQSIYDFDKIDAAFNIKMDGISYLMIALVAVLTIKNLAICIFNCIARIFTLLGLYVIAPPIIAVMPLDGGEKFKQWTTSAVIQMFGIFGSIIPMRLVILFVPIVMDSKLELFSSLSMNVLAKAVLILGSIEAANRFNGIITGILANSAGQAAVRSGDMSDYANRFTGRAFGAAKSAALGTASFAAKASGVYAAGKAIGDKASSIGNYMTQHGGILFGSMHYLRESGKKKDDDKGKDKLPPNLNKKK